MYKFFMVTVSLTSANRQLRESVATPSFVKHKGNIEKENYFQKNIAQGI